LAANALTKTPSRRIGLNGDKLLYTYVQDVFAFRQTRDRMCGDRAGAPRPEADIAA
jgi:hypothetical protein